MIIDTDKYVKYVAYVKLYDTFKERVSKLNSTRPVTNTFLSVLRDVYDELVRCVDYVPIKDTDSLDNIAMKKEQRRMNTKFVEYLFNARSDYVKGINELIRPTVSSVYKRLEGIISVHKDNLLKIYH